MEGFFMRFQNINAALNVCYLFRNTTADYCHGCVNVKSFVDHSGNKAFRNITVHVLIFAVIIIIMIIFTVRKCSGRDIATIKTIIITTVHIHSPIRAQLIEHDVP